MGMQKIYISNPYKRQDFCTVTCKKRCRNMSSYSDAILVAGIPVDIYFLSPDVFVFSTEDHAKLLLPSSQLKTAPLFYPSLAKHLFGILTPAKQRKVISTAKEFLIANNNGYFDLNILNSGIARRLDNVIVALCYIQAMFKLYPHDFKISLDRPYVNLGPVKVFVLLEENYIKAIQKDCSFDIKAIEPYLKVLSQGIVNDTSLHLSERKFNALIALKAEILKNQVSGTEGSSNLENIQRIIEKEYMISGISDIEEIDELSFSNKLWVQAIQSIYNHFSEDTANLASHPRGVFDRMSEDLNFPYKTFEEAVASKIRARGGDLPDFSKKLISFGANNSIENPYHDALREQLLLISNCLFPNSPGKEAWPLFVLTLNTHLIRTTKDSYKANALPNVFFPTAYSDMLIPAVSTSRVINEVSKVIKDSTEVSLAIASLRFIKWSDIIVKDNLSMSHFLKIYFANYYNTKLVKNKSFASLENFETSELDVFAVNLLARHYFVMFRKNVVGFSLNHFVKDFLFRQLEITYCSSVAEEILIRNKAILQSTERLGLFLPPEKRKYFDSNSLSRIVDLSFFNISAGFLDNLIKDQGEFPKIGVFDQKKVLVDTDVYPSFKNKYSAISISDTAYNSSGIYLEISSLIDRLTVFTKLPMVSPPADWKRVFPKPGAFCGGYLLNRSKVSLVKPIQNGTSSIVFSEEALSAINRTQAFGFRLEKKVDFSDPRIRKELGLLPDIEFQKLKAKHAELKNELLKVEEDLTAECYRKFSSEYFNFINKNDEAHLFLESSGEVISQEDALLQINKKVISSRSEQFLQVKTNSPDPRDRLCVKKFELLRNFKPINHKVVSQLSLRKYIDEYLKLFFFKFFNDITFYYPALVDFRGRIYHSSKGVTKVSHSTLRSLLVLSDSQQLDESGMETLMLVLAESFYKGLTRSKHLEIMNRYVNFYKFGDTNNSLSKEDYEKFTKMKEEDHLKFSVRRIAGVVNEKIRCGKASTSLLSENDQTASGPTIASLCFGDKKLAEMTNALSKGERNDIYKIWSTGAIALLNTVLNLPDKQGYVPESSPYDDICVQDFRLKKQPRKPRRITKTLSAAKASCLKTLLHKADDLKAIFEMLECRDFAKGSVMPFFYSMGLKGLIGKIYEYLNEKNILDRYDPDMVEALAKVLHISLLSISPATNAGLRIIKGIADLSIKYTKNFCYAHPCGTQGSFAYIKQDESYRLVSYRGRQRLKLKSVKRTETGAFIVSTQQGIASPSNFIHSIDSYFVRAATALYYKKKSKILLTVHDAFLTHPNDGNFVIQMLKKLYIETFSSFDFIENLFNENLRNATCKEHREELEILKEEFHKLQRRLRDNNQFLDLKDPQVQKDIMQSDHMFYSGS